MQSNSHFYSANKSTHRQQVTWAARVICGGLLLASVIGALATSGPLGFSWLAAPIAIMAAGWLLGQRVAMMLSFMGVAGVLAIYLLYTQGFSFDTHLLHEQAIALQIIALLLSARVGNAIAENFRKQWLEKARSQAHLQALFNSTDDLVWSVDPTHFGLLNYNTAFADYLTDSHGLVAQPGLSPAELFPDIVLLQKWELLYRQALSLGASLTSEGELFGDGLWVQVRLQVMNHEAECFGISVFARDMTYERDIERQREQGFEFQQRLIESIPGMFFLLDRQGQCLLWNRNFQNSYAMENSELARFHPLDSVVEEDRERVRLAMAQVFERGKAGVEARITSPQGTVAEFMLTGYRVDWNGQPTLLGIGVDITKRKKIERELTEAVGRTQQALEVRNRFLAHMSHELRTPMNGILGLSELARHEHSVEALSEHLERIHFSASNLLHIINDILDFSSMDAGALEIRPVIFSLHDLTRDVLEIVRYKAQAKALSLTCQIDSELPRHLCGDGSRLKQILLNLLDNAVKFTRQGQVVLSVRLQSRDEQMSRIELSFEVTDTGAGISAEGMTRLFQPFSQVDDTASRQYGGTGLGLVISGNLVDLMGGQGIQVNSTLGLGSTFGFRLPFGTVASEQTPIPSPPSVPQQPLKPLQGIRALIVEDNRINQMVLKTLLERQGATTHLCHDGQQAVECLRESPTDFDIVLMDIQMPVMDGYTATRLIRQQIGLTHLPIIAVTAHAMEHDRQESLACGMNGHITKPVDKEQLFEVILEQVRPPAQARTGFP
jgi:PAS domain S-box-containing protein